MQLNRATLALLLTSLVGCIQEPGIRDEFRVTDYHFVVGEKYSLELAAPVIVLGKVAEVTKVGYPMTSQGDPRIKTQLTRITISVEQMIKGALAEKVIEFYFFVYSTENTADLGVPRYVPQVGQQRIYFLKPWRKTFRSVGDVLNYTISTASGIHKAGFCQGKEPGCCIAEILLVPERDRDTDGFVRDLWPAAFAAAHFCSPGRARELVIALRRDPDPRVSGSAAEAVSMLDEWWPHLKSSAH